MSPYTTVVIGSGLAAFNLAKEFRKISNDPLILITEEEGHFYSKPMLSNALHQSKTPESLIITHVDTIATQLNATILSKTTVTQINPLTKTLSLQTSQGQETLGYHQLVLALGARPKPFPLLSNIPHYRINHLADYADFIKKARSCQHLTIIGSGLVGCEFAYDLSRLPLKIEILTPDPYPLYGIVPKPIGEQLQRVLENKGIIWHTQVQLQEATRTSHGLTIHLNTKQIHHTEAILCAIGLSPNIAMAGNAGIHINRGIVVDDYLQTNIPDIFALGDCAEIQGVCRQYIAPILHCARSLSKTLCQQPTKLTLPPMPVSLKVADYPITFVVPNQWNGEWQLEQKENDYKALYHNEHGQLTGYVLTGKYLEERSQCLQMLIEEQTELV